MIGAWRWPRFLAHVRRRRRPIVRLWDREFNYVATLADGRRETWGEYGRRLARAVFRPAEVPARQVVEVPRGTITLDTLDA